MKIDSCIIVKNGLFYIEDLVNNLSKFSTNIYITDTGSTDHTYEKLIDLQKKFNNLHIDIFEWIDDFSAARNHVWDKSTDSDYRFFCDVGDLFTDSLIEELIEFSKKDYNEKLPDVIFIYRHYGRTICPITGLVKNKEHLKWSDPIHEYINFTYKDYVEQYYFKDDSYLIHDSVRLRTPDHANRNIDIFRNMEMSKYKFSSRNLMYYANELFDHCNYILAYKMYEEAFNNYDNGLTFANQLEIFVLMTGCSYNIHSETLITNNLTSYGETLYDHGVRHKILTNILGTIYYEHKNWNSAINMFLETIKYKDIQQEHLQLVSNNIDWFYIYISLCVCYDNIKDYQNSNKYNELALSINPSNETALYNKEYLKQFLN